MGNHFKNLQGGIKPQSQKDEVVNLQRNVIAIFAIIGVVIVFIGYYVYNIYELTPNFVVSHQSYYYISLSGYSPIIMIAGAAITVACLGIIFSLPSTKDKEESSLVRVCIGCGYPLPKNVKFCPRCGKTVEKITVEQ